MSLSRPPGPWEDEGSVSWDGSLSTSTGQASVRGGDWGRLSSGDVLSYCCPTELMGFILHLESCGKLCGSGFVPSQPCIKSKGYLSILQRQQETMVPDLGCGGGRLQSKGFVWVFAFPGLCG